MHRKYPSILSLFCLLLLSACTGAGLTIANAPTAFFDGEIERNLVYDEARKLGLDVYTPDVATAEKLPVVIFFYGGRWTDGMKEDYAFVGAALAEKGFVVVIPDYRKYPDVRFPDFIDDGAKAVNWVHNNIGRFQGEPRALFLAGHSSGAHIASLLAVDERYLDMETRRAVKGFAGLAGPYAFTPKSDDLKEIFGPPSQYPQMQATTFIEGREPPLLLIYGREDTSVGLFNLERLVQKVEEKDGRVETIIYPDIDHVEIVGALSWIWRSKAPVLEDMTSFFRKLAVN